jgi:hypothetical protein
MFEKNTAIIYFKLITRLMPILAVCVFMFSTTVQAVPLGLDPFDTPDIFSGYINVNYDSATDNFTASGYALEFDDDGVGAPHQIASGSFELTATINASGVLQTGGTLAIVGTVADLGFNSGTLLTGNLTAFGFPDAGGDPLEFYLDITGGDAAGLYGFAPTGVILTSSGFGGRFDENFSNTAYTGLANTIAQTPEPSTILLLITGLGVVGVCSVIRKRSKRAKE